MHIHLLATCMLVVEHVLCWHAADPDKQHQRHVRLLSDSYAGSIREHAPSLRALLGHRLLRATYSVFQRDLVHNGL